MTSIRTTVILAALVTSACSGGTVSPSTVSSSPPEATASPIAVAPSSSPPKTTTTTPLDGEWEVTYTRDELIAAGADPSEVQPENYGHITLTLDRGTFNDGTYVVDGDKISFYVGAEVWNYRWSVYGDTLTFEKLGGQAPDCTLSASLNQCEPTGLVVKPFRRVSG